MIMSNAKQAKVWLIPASDPQSTRNIARSMESEIDAAIRLSMQAQGLNFRFAWGAKQGHGKKNRSQFSRMEIGDLCLFYTADQRSADEPRTAYRWMAKILGKADDLALADRIWPPNPTEPESFPLIYFLTEPVRIHLPAEQLSALLDPEGVKYREGQRGFTTLAPENAEYVNQRFGSVAGLMQALLDYAQEDPPAGDYPELYQPLSPTMDATPTESVQFSTTLLVTVTSKEPNMKKKAIYSPSRRSRQAKETGDKAELLVYRLLQEGKIKNVTASDVQHVAQEKRGWDIEYTNPDGETVCVEVKGSATDRFYNFELTQNELEQLHQHKDRYHFYLVANCLSPHPVIQIIDDMAERLARQSAQVTALTYRLELLA